MLATASKRVVFSAKRQLSSTAAAASCLPASLVEARVTQVVSTFKSVSPDLSANPSSLFVADLGLDRLQIRDLVQQLGQEFCVDVPYATADGFVSIQSATEFFKAHPKAR